MSNNIATRILALVVSVAACAFAQSAQVPASCTFQSVQIQTDYTSVYGINNRGAIVGTYNPNSSAQWGFVLKNGTVTNIAWPNAAFTSAYAVNDYGAVVGAYATGLKNPNQGFKWVNGTFTNITYPGALATYAQGINIHGEIVGDYQDSAGGFHGFTFSGGKYVTLDYPGAQGTVISGINNNGVISGGYTDSANVEHGFIDRNGTFTVIDYPGAGSTIVSAVNDNGVIAGTYYDSSFSTWDGFVFLNGKFTNIVDPSASTETAVTGINKAGILVGNADYSGAGFKAINCAP